MSRHDLHACEKRSSSHQSAPCQSIRFEFRHFARVTQVLGLRRAHRCVRWRDLLFQQPRNPSPEVVDPSVPVARPHCEQPDDARPFCPPMHTIPRCRRKSHGLPYKMVSMSVLVKAPPAPSTAKLSRSNSGSSGDSAARFTCGAGPSCATGFPFLAIMMRSPRSARATNWDRRVFAAWTFTSLSDIRLD